MYVTIKWWDDSVKVLETIDRGVIKDKLGIELEDDEVYDVIHKRKVVIPEGCTVDYTDSYPELKGVDLDANRFI